MDRHVVSGMIFILALSVAVDADEEPETGGLQPRAGKASKTIGQSDKRMIVVVSDADLGAYFRTGYSNWKECQGNIDLIADQGPCKVCGGVTGSSTISNRRCIAHVNGLISSDLIGGMTLADLYDEQISADQAIACFDFKDGQVRNPATRCRKPDGILPCRKMVDCECIFLEEPVYPFIGYQEYTPWIAHPKYTICL